MEDTNFGRSESTDWTREAGQSRRPPPANGGAACGHGATIPIGCGPIPEIEIRGLSPVSSEKPPANLANPTFPSPSNSSATASPAASRKTNTNDHVLGSGGTRAAGLRPAKGLKVLGKRLERLASDGGGVQEAKSFFVGGEDGVAEAVGDAGKSCFEHVEHRFL